MTLYRKTHGTDYMMVGDYMFTAKDWVETRMGWAKISESGKQITVHDATRPPGTYGEYRDQSWATAGKGHYILHNGDGQFRILTKAQFDYWYEEKE